MEKVQATLQLIDEHYVDTVNTDQLLEGNSSPDATTGSTLLFPYSRTTLEKESLKRLTTV